MNNKTEKMKELIDLFRRAAEDIQNSFNAWDCESRHEFCEEITKRLHACKGLSISLGGTVIAPDLKPIVEYALGNIPEAHLDAIKENASIQEQITALRYPFLDQKTVRLVNACAFFSSWAGRGMRPHAFPMMAIALYRAHQEGADIYGEEFAENAPDKAPVQEIEPSVGDFFKALKAVIKHEGEN